jgi:hypothetical protein
VREVLGFLQAQVNRGLAFRTIGVYRSAISKFHLGIAGSAIGQHPSVCRFMKGVLNKRPPCRTLLPTWSLRTVLKFLKGFPFIPHGRVSLEAIALKTIANCYFLGEKSF